jgi:hypothetical protein
MQSFKMQTKNSQTNESGSGGGKKIGTVFGILIILAFVWFLWGGSGEVKTQPTAQQRFEDDIYSKVVSDSIQEYEIVKRSGNKIDICVHSGFVAAAYLQAKDETGYRQWKDIESADCTEAGMPPQI